ncbi:MAG: hypothetical protein VX090_08965, partial [Pseudomonadota bacterium]|nr:hypothetical protein [Pseudomonadota bacterium]
ELLKAAFTLAERFGLLSLILPPSQKVWVQGVKPKRDEAKGNHIGDPTPLLMQYAHPHHRGVCADYRRQNMHYQNIEGVE